MGDFAGELERSASKGVISQAVFAAVRRRRCRTCQQVANSARRRSIYIRSGRRRWPDPPRPKIRQLKPSPQPVYLLTLTESSSNKLRIAAHVDRSYFHQARHPAAPSNLVIVEAGAVGIIPKRLEHHCSL